MRFYRAAGLVMASIFAATGILFLFFPGDVLRFFNSVASLWSWSQSPEYGFDFYLILAAAYMYIVTVLAFLMFRNPRNPAFPVLLANAKFASAVLSLAFFVWHAHYLIYLANFIVDGAIGGLVVVLLGRARRLGWASS